jgi:ADP-dependent NAD(P)H-hydrate dehydratase / NAD(P)H-hydrate epimerase
MNPVLSVQQMRTIDERSIAGATEIGYRYMQKAGVGLYNAARKMAPDVSAGEIAIVCGKGNNGGDGYVAGRLLRDEGYHVMCFSLVQREALSGECLLAYNEFIASKGNVLTIDDIADFPHPSRFQLIVDALLGTGLKGDPHGLYASMINVINGSGTPVLAVDTPSGLDNDTGAAGTPCVKATATVAMGFSKIGHYFFPGRELTGTLIVENLNYPDEIVAEVKSGICFPTMEDFRRLVPLRKPSGSKYDHGQVLLVGGSPGMSGAVTLMAESALRGGCGMVHCAFPGSLAGVLAMKLTEPVLHALRATGEGVVDGSAAEEVLSMTSDKQALCMGPGLSHADSVRGLVRKVICGCRIPTILDADGINAFKGKTDLLVEHAGDLLLTPHVREFERLFGTLAPLPVDRIEQIREVALRYELTLLLKGNPTICAGKNGDAVLLPFGNSALAKAGSGDVLSGLITSLVAQGADVADAAVLGAYIHGEAGRLASRKLSEYAVTARDVVMMIPGVFGLLLGRKNGPVAE